MCSGRSRTARETQNIPLAVPEQSIAPLKEMLKRSLPASSHLADREVFPFLFSLPKKPIPERELTPPARRWLMYPHVRAPLQAARQALRSKKNAPTIHAGCLCNLAREYLTI